MGVLIVPLQLLLPSENCVLTSRFSDAKTSSNQSTTDWQGLLPESLS